jgi:hypothetical protein
VIDPQANRPGRATTSRPASWAPADQWRLYRAWGDLPPESGWRARLTAWLLGDWQHLLYIGITGRTTMARWAEHMRDKWWAPDVATWERDPRVYGTLTEVEAAEKQAIERERPVHNVAHNGNNPGRVRLRRHLPRHVVAARLRYARWAALWVVLFGGMWILGSGAWEGGDEPRYAAVSASALWAAGWWRWRQRTNPKRARSRRKRSRR